MKYSWPQWILKHRWFVVFIYVLATVTAAVFALRIQFDFNFQEYFPENDPVRDAYREQLRDFPGEVSEFVVIVEDAHLFSQQGMAQLRKLTTGLENTGHFSAVNSLVNLPKEVFGRFAVTYSQICLGQAFEPNVYDLFKQEALTHPLLIDQLILSQGRVTALRATLLPELANDKGRERVRKSVAAALVPFYPDFDEIFYTGFSGTRADFAVTIKREQRLLFPLVFLMIVVVLFLFLGRTWLILLPFLTSLIAVIWTIGLMVLGNAPFTILSSGTPLLVMIIGISDSLHIFYHLRDDLKQGMTKEQAVVGTFKFLGRSCFLTSITTSIGFMALSFTNLPILKEFGLFTGIGIMLNYLVLMGLLPILFYYFPVRALEFTSFSRMEALQDRGIRSLIQFTSKPGRWLPIFTLFTLLVSLGIKDIYEETRVYQGLAERNQLYQNIKKAETKLGGLLPIGVTLRFGEDDDLFSDRTLQGVKSIQEYLNAQEEIVGSTFSLHNIVQFLSTSLTSAERDIEFDSKRTLSLRNQLLLLRRVNQGLVDGVINFEKKKLIIRCRVKDIGSTRFRMFQADLEEFMAEKHQRFSWTIAGLPNLSLRLSEKVVSYILRTFFLACGVIFLGFLLGFRSFKMAAISILPNIIPLLFILGFLGWTKIPLQPSVVVVFCIVYGIAVNNTIHFINRYLEERREGREDYLEVTIRSTGKAIISSSVVLIAGFAILAYSEFLGLAYLGLLLSVGVTAALICDLLFLPLALKKFT